jgi:anti-anti-sigma factor
MEQRLDVVVSAVNGAAFVRPEGVLDIDRADRFEHEVQTALETDPTDVVIDLRGVTFLDSIGLRALFRACGWCEQEHVGLSVVAGNPAVQRILRATGADVWLPVVADVPARLRSPSDP